MEPILLFLKNESTLSPSKLYRFTTESIFFYYNETVLHIKKFTQNPLKRLILSKEKNTHQLFVRKAII